MMTKDYKRPSFLRLFVGGFTLGTAALIGVQVAQAGPGALVPVAHATTR